MPIDSLWDSRNIQSSFKWLKITIVAYTYVEVDAIIYTGVCCAIVCKSTGHES